MPMSMSGQTWRVRHGPEYRRHTWVYNLAKTNRIVKLCKGHVYACHVLSTFEPDVHDT